MVNLHFDLSPCLLWVVTLFYARVFVASKSCCKIKLWDERSECSNTYCLNFVDGDCQGQWGRWHRVEASSIVLVGIGNDFVSSYRDFAEICGERSTSTCTKISVWHQPFFLPLGGLFSVSGCIHSNHSIAMVKFYFQFERVRLKNRSWNLLLDGFA